MTILTYGILSGHMAGDSRLGVVAHGLLQLQYFCVAAPTKRSLSLQVC